MSTILLIELIPQTSNFSFSHLGDSSILTFFIINAVYLKQSSLFSISTDIESLSVSFVFILG